jgi:hypothetical protein
MGPRQYFPMSFEDHFSQLAQGYAAYRPTYPNALFDYLASIAPDRQLAWDCGTGSGQAALALANHFQRVVATDASPDQLLLESAKEAYLAARAVNKDPGIVRFDLRMLDALFASHPQDVDLFAEVRTTAGAGIAN